MAYTPINWQTGQTITAEKLNKMDNGWGKQETQIFSDSVTTESGDYGNEAEISIPQITSEEIVVTFNNTDYTCQFLDINDGEGSGYGGVDAGWDYDFTNYPFAIVSTTSGTYFATENAGTYQVVVKTVDLQISSDFAEVVDKCVDLSSMPLFCVSGVTTEHEMTTQSKLMYFWADSRCFIITLAVSNEIRFIPESNDISATFVDHVFTVTVS